MLQFAKLKTNIKLKIAKLKTNIKLYLYMKCMNTLTVGDFMLSYLPKTKRCSSLCLPEYVLF